MVQYGAVWCSMVQYVVLYGVDSWLQSLHEVLAVHKQQQLVQ